MFPRYQTSATYGDFKIRKLRPNSVFWHTSIDESWRVETNSKGLRNKQEFAYNKPHGVVRILSSGDFHTEGFEVRQEYTFSSVIQRKLNENGLKAEVINAGVSGFSNAEELIFLENEGIKYNRNYVMPAFFANDFSDYIRAGIFILGNNSQLVISKKILCSRSRNSESTHRKFAEAITNCIMADLKDSTLDPVETSSDMHVSGLTD